MARSIHVRLDRESESALALLHNLGMNDSEAVRTALKEIAARRRSPEALRAEVTRLAADPVDREEVRRIRAEMDEVAAEWPDD